MDDKRKRLLKLIEIFKLPLTLKEAEEHVNNLSDEDVDLLVSTYEDVLNYQNAVSESVRLADPKSYEEMNKEYDKKVKQAELKYLNNLEQLQEKKDMELDEVEKQASGEINSAVKNQDTELDELESAHEDLYSRLEKAASS